MTEYTIEYGVRVGNGIAAMIKGDVPIHVGDQLTYPNGKTVTVVGIGSGRVIDSVTDVLLDGDYDTTQDKAIL